MKKAGFTLVERMVALTVSSVLVASILGLLISQRRVGWGSGRRSIGPVASTGVENRRWNRYTRLVDGGALDSVIQLSLTPIEAR